MEKENKEKVSEEDMIDKKGIDIVIVNYFSSAKINTLLQSIEASSIDKELISIIIINNTKEDDLTILELSKIYKVIINENNMGFGYACNQALDYCSHEYILLLNPDTLLLPQTLQVGYDFMEQFLDITVTGVKHRNTDGQLAASYGIFPTLANFTYEITGLSKINSRWFKGALLAPELHSTTSKYVNHVMGAFMMIRKSFIDEFGFMDTRFFVFLEDVDFCKKVWLNKHKVYYNANIEIVHEGGSSSNNIGGKKLCYMLEGKLKYAHKYFSTTAWVTLLLMVLLLEPLMRIIWSIITLNFKKIAETFEGYFLFFKRRQFK